MHLHAFLRTDGKSNTAHSGTVISHRACVYIYIKHLTKMDRCVVVAIILTIALYFRKTSDTNKCGVVFLNMLF